MRTLNAQFLEDIANREDIRPALGGKGPIKLQPLLTAPGGMAYAFRNDEGGFFVHRLNGNTFECHSLFVPERKGARGIVELMKDSLKFMFLNTDCDEIITRVPEGYEGARMVAGIGGFKIVGWQFNWDGDKKAQLMGLPLDAWALTCYGAKEAGRQFHDLIERAKEEAQSMLLAHKEDDLHDRMVGVAILMIKAGNAVKGINFYNRWASLYGYASIALYSSQPLVINIRDALVSVIDGQAEVLQCR